MSYRLRKDEVQHELRVRGLPVEGDVYELRKRLQTALTNKTAVDTEAVGKLNINSELEICEEKFSDLSELVDAFDAGVKNNEYWRIEARLQHLLGRLQLVRDREGKEETIAGRLSNLEGKIKTAMEQLEQKLTRTPEVNKTEPPVFPLATGSENKITLQVPTPKEISHSKATDSESQSQSQNRLEFSPKPTESQRRSVPVYKWNITFDGGPKVSVGSFLERIEELRIARGISEKELLDSAVDLFAGSALIWHRSNRQRIGSWEQLKTELKAVFQNPDYDHLLLKEILNRTQGEHENIDLYLATMNVLYSRLTEKIPEEKQLTQILKNLNNYLQDKLCMLNITSLEELRNLARRAELGRIRSTTQHPPPKPNIVMEPDLAYCGPRRQHGSQYVSAIQSTPRLPNLTCWNCGEGGHMSRYCQKPRKTFCYGCGAPNVKRAECQKCTPKNL
ncbi:uncharacterized protein LOC128982646 [Macrosteles quadrilineatus]|uniref:uncharacterized protein LOC128982646 n=1 Tax=Macrosteles quadrilineatus TaxID=74068 RepID=UPI0023E27CE6|nr:uncharacterized protein LOC128982646 [Macrosteles quadrilineatus]